MYPRARRRLKRPRGFFLFGDSPFSLAQCRLSARGGNSLRSTFDPEQSFASVRRQSKVAGHLRGAYKAAIQIVSRADGQPRFSRLSEDDFAETAMVRCKKDMEMY